MANEDGRVLHLEGDLDDVKDALTALNSGGELGFAPAWASDFGPCAVYLRKDTGAFIHLPTIEGMTAFPDYFSDLLGGPWVPETEKPVAGTRVGGLLDTSFVDAAGVNSTYTTVYSFPLPAYAGVGDIFEILVAGTSNGSGNGTSIISAFVDSTSAGGGSVISANAFWRLRATIAVISSSLLSLTIEQNSMNAAGAPQSKVVYAEVAGAAGAVLTVQARQESPEVITKKFGTVHYRPAYVA